MEESLRKVVLFQKLCARHVVLYRNVSFALFMIAARLAEQAISRMASFTDTGKRLQQ